MTTCTSTAPNLLQSSLITYSSALSVCGLRAVCSLAGQTSSNGRHKLAEAMAPQYVHANSDSEQDRLLKQFFTTPFKKGYVRVGPNKVLMPICYLNYADRIENLEVRNSDVWVMSHPKTGTTWTQEMTWLIQNDLDFEGAKVPLQERFPFLDHTQLFDCSEVLKKLPDLQFPSFITDSVTYVEEMKSPRFIKTHLPWELLPKQIQDGTKQPKIIYVARNPKDTCVSFYHHCRILEGYSGSFENFCKLFIGGSVIYTPFWSHILNFWKRRDEPNILFLKYEDLKRDLPAEIKKTAQFLGKELNEAEVSLLAEHLSFDSMKNNPAVNYEALIDNSRKFILISEDGHFMRSGQVGNYKEAMSPEIILEFDQWTQENLAGSTLSF